jgi:hypothetical protein
MLKAYETSGNVLFEEKQKFPKWVSWLMWVSMVITVIGLLIGFLAGEEKTEMTIELAVVIPIAALAIYLHTNTQLEKIVTSNGMYYRWKPLHKKFRIIENEEIQAVVRRKFFSRSYGFGWFPGYGRYYNASSGEGLQLYLKNGKRFYFSTADINAFDGAINHLIIPLQNQV